MADDKTPDTSDFSAFMKKVGLPTGAQVKAEKEKAFEGYKERRAPILAEQDRLLGAMRDLNSKMQDIKAPSAPKLEDITPPPDTEYRDPTQALGSIASVLAMLGSMKTRAPLTAALNSAASSMIGFHQGDKERAKLEREKWQDNLYRGLQQNQIELQKYMSELQKANFDMSKAQNGFRLIAAENDHQQMMAAIEAGDFNAQMAIIDGSLKANQEAAKLWVTDQEKRAQIDATKAYREAVVGARAADKTRAESFKLRGEYQKRLGPVTKSVSELSEAESLLQGNTPGEKILGIRKLQHVIGGSNRLKLDAAQMQNFGDIAERVLGWGSKIVLGELTDAQYQQLLSGVKTLRQKEEARAKSIEDDIRSTVKAGKLDPAIVFGESDDGGEPPSGPQTPPAGGGKDLDYFLGKGG